MRRGFPANILRDAILWVFPEELTSKLATLISTQYSMAEAPSEETTKRMKSSQQVPLPMDMERSKLDWLLQINEEYFEEQLRTVVSRFKLLILLILRTPN